MLFFGPLDLFEPYNLCVGTYIKCQGCFLYLHKPLTTKSPYPDCWGVPAGKVREDEEKSDANDREVFQETGLRLECVQMLRPFMMVHHKRLLYYAYFAEFEQFPEIRRSAEHDAHGWFTKAQLSQMKLIPDEYRIFSFLNL